MESDVSNMSVAAGQHVYFCFTHLKHVWERDTLTRSWLLEAFLATCNHKALVKLERHLFTCMIHLSLGCCEHWNRKLRSSMSLPTSLICESSASVEMAVKEKEIKSEWKKQRE